MPYGNLNVDVVQSSTAGTPVQFNDGNGTQVGTLCRAWVNFNGASPSAINGSFNVSSVTYSTTGRYVVNFSTAMSNANYSPVISGCGPGAYSNQFLTSLTAGQTLSVNSFGISTGNSTNNASADASFIAVAVFR